MTQKGKYKGKRDMERKKNRNREVKIDRKTEIKRLREI